MTVKVRPYNKGSSQGWEVDIMLTIPGRPRIRERRRAPVRSKSDAKRWGEERERQLIQHYTNTDPEEDARPDLVKKEVPTLAAFIPRYLEGHCKASRLRPATIYGRQSAYRKHLIPALGRKRLNRITVEDIQRFKAERMHLKASTINFLLRCLRGILNVAVEWGVIEKLPVRIKKLKEDPPNVKYYEARELDRLVLEAERKGHPGALLVVLLGAEAGLRSGEMRALRWADVDRRRKVLQVSCSIWRGHEGPTKGGRMRTIPLAPRLAAALAKHRHLRDPFVLPTRSHEVIREWLAELQDAAGLLKSGPHILRHTFCSHLAMAGKPVRVIQSLAGHASLTTTERYMHLAPEAERDAIDALRRPEDWRNVGEGHEKVKKIV